MKRRVFFQTLICLITVSTLACFYLSKQNDLTRLRMEIPTVAENLKMIEEENARLQYEIECFENPCHLMDLAKYSEYGHLRHPLTDDILVLVMASQPSASHSMEISGNRRAENMLTQKRSRLSPFLSILLGIRLK